MGSAFPHMSRPSCLWAPAFVAGLVAAGSAGRDATGDGAPIELGSRLELFVDEFLIENLSGLALKLQAPVAREVSIVFDAPWEGNTSAYWTVFEDEGRLRLYYRASNYDLATGKYSSERVCYAESRDGIHWQKPELGLFEFGGSTRNNIVWQGPGTHNFAPFKDQNPACPPEARYKALASGADGGKLVAFKSADGIHWSVWRPEPVITEGAFDSQNLGYWDVCRGRYVEFHRGFRNGVRDILTSTSDDFLNWTKPEWLDYGETPPEQLYTNAITAYFRAPHLFLGFPKRFVENRKSLEHNIPGVSDGVFMTSRDGHHWRRWREAFIRPGLQASRWVNRNNLTAWGLVRTKSDIPGNPDEISLYSSEGYYVGPCQLRRYTLRLDGFVSVNAPAAGGEFTTKLLTYAPAAAPGAAGTELILNYSTSAPGSIRVELLGADGKPVPGFSLAECDAIFGDHNERAVRWQGKSDVGVLAGQPVRLRFVMSDADLYSIQFR